MGPPRSQLRGFAALGGGAFRALGRPGGAKSLGTLTDLSTHSEPLFGFERGFRLRILLDQLFERAARSGVVVQVRLRRCDVQQCVGDFGTRRIVRDQQTLRRNRRAIVFARVLGVANPVLCKVSGLLRSDALARNDKKLRQMLYS